MRRPSERRWIAASAVWLLALSAGACALVTTVRGPARGFPPPEGRAVAGTELIDLKGIVHCHSFLSHDSPGTVEAIAAAAREVGADFVVMTDHQTEASIAAGTRGERDGTLFVVGAELACAGGSLLAFPLQRPLPKDAPLAEILADVHAQGGLAVLGHAESFTAWDAEGLDGVEILNLHAAARAAPPVEVILRFLFTPVRNLVASLARVPPENLRALDAQLARRPLFVCAGTDAHDNLRFGPFGTLANYRELFRVATTHVLAERCDEAALVAAFRAGRTYVAIDAYRDATGFDFRAVSAAGVHLLGSTVPLTDDLELCVRVPAPAEIRLLRDGAVILRARGRELRTRAAEPGVYRVECHVPPRFGWIWSSAIRIVRA